jgi:hypothetical protein
MKTAGLAAATTTKKRRVGWFENDKDHMQPLIEKKAELLHRSRNPNPQDDLETIQSNLKIASKEVKDRTEIAKSIWAKKLGEKVNHVNVTPKQAWEAAYEIKDGVKGHHTHPIAMKFRRANGSLAANPQENAEAVEAHFTKVLNSERPTLANAAETVQQRVTQEELGEKPTWEELKRAVVKLKNDKKPGMNGVMPNAYKCLDDENLSTLYEYITKFWEGDVDFSEWHEGLGVLVPKKGNLHDLNKWRLINLMDVGSKIVSCILTERAYSLLKTNCVKTQFGATPLVGCQDGNFTLKTLLHLRHQHNLPSYVAFIDLVKAYDTANHKLLIELLARYGAPRKLCDIVERLYSDLTVTINVEGIKVIVKQTSGVRQGDNLSPVLFLFLMSAVAESLNNAVEESEIEQHL